MQNGPTYQFFTAAQIAAALKVSKRSVLNWLEKSRADSVALVKGQEAKAWSFQNMPQ